MSAELLKKLAQSEISSVLIRTNAIGVREMIEDPKIENIRYDDST